MQVVSPTITGAEVLTPQRAVRPALRWPRPATSCLASRPPKYATSPTAVHRAYRALPCSTKRLLSARPSASGHLRSTTAQAGNRAECSRWEGHPTNLAGAANSCPIARSFIPTSSLSPFSSSSVAFTIRTSLRCASPGAVGEVERWSYSLSCEARGSPGVRVRIATRDWSE